LLNFSIYNRVNLLLWRDQFWAVRFKVFVAAMGWMLGVFLIGNRSDGGWGDGELASLLPLLPLLFFPTPYTLHSYPIFYAR
jgi:hypothetical protein